MIEPTPARYLRRVLLELEESTNVTNTNRTDDDADNVDPPEDAKNGVRIATVVMILLYPLFMLWCQYLLDKNKKNRLIKKRSMFMIKIASTLPGFLAWVNLIVSLDVGAPCWVFFLLTILVAPLSIGPQLTRAIRLWSMYRLSHLMLSHDVIPTSVKREQSMSLTPNGKRGGTTMLQRQQTDSAVKSALEVNRIKQVTKLAMRVSVWGFLVVPTGTLLVLSMLLPSADELTDTEYEHCSVSPPISIKYLSPANGMIIALLAISGTILLRHSTDELGIRHEISRNIFIWAATYVLLIVMRYFGNGWVSPLMIAIQQMLLSYSMIVMPCHHTDSVFFFLFKSATSAQIHGEQGSYYGNESGSMSSIGRSLRQSSSSERSVYDTDLETMLSTERGIKKFSEHCAKEFSMENIRFWQAVNHYRTTSLELEATPVTSERTEELHDTAMAIWETYIAPGSEMEVNIPNTMAKLIKVDIESMQVSSALFDRAQEEIFNLMSRDSYQRYLQSRHKADMKERK
jgi:regulator of G-protein signaling